MNTFNFKKSQLAASVSLIIAASTLNTAIAAEAETSVSSDVEVIEVKGIG